MDRGRLLHTVHGIAESDMTRATKYKAQHIPKHKIFFSIKILVMFHFYIHAASELKLFHLIWSPFVFHFSAEQDRAVQRCQSA